MYLNPKHKRNIFRHKKRDKKIPPKFSQPGTLGSGKSRKICLELAVM
jgi:hypothetical protein